MHPRILVFPAAQLTPKLSAAMRGRVAMHLTEPEEMKTTKTMSGAPASQNGRLPYKLQKSPIQGRGAFATRNIKKGERIVEYKGERIGNREADRRYPDPEPGDHHHTFLFELDEKTCVDAAVGGNSARFINHSCNPNCEAVIEEGHIYIDALRDIRRGEELVYDYNYILEDRHSPANKRLYPCHCGARKCRGTILGRKR